MTNKKRTLTNLASEYHVGRTSSKYSLAQIQALIDKMSNLEWQVSGPKSEQNLSLKSVSNKVLTQVTNINSNLKLLQQELKSSNDGLADALNKGLNAMATALTGLTGPQAPPEMPTAKGVVGSAGHAPKYGQPGYQARTGLDSIRLWGKEFPLLPPCLRHHPICQHQSPALFLWLIITTLFNYLQKQWPS